MSIRHQREKADLLIAAETWEREVEVKRALEKIQRAQTLERRQEDYHAQQVAVLKQNLLGENWISSTLKPRIVQGLRKTRQGWGIFVPDDSLKAAKALIGGKINV